MKRWRWIGDQDTHGPNTIMHWPSWKRYGFAAVMVICAAAIVRLFEPWVAPTLSPPYFLAVLLASAFAGTGPGLLATAMSAFAIAWFDLGSKHQLDLGLDDLIRLSVFSITAVLISSISAARQEAEQELRMALDELSSIDRAKDEFIAAVSHELRNPLTSILGWIRLMKDGALDAETTQLAIESIEQSAQTQSLLIDDLLDMSRMMLGKLHIDRQPILIREAVQGALTAIRPVAEPKGLHIQFLDEAPSAVVEGDPARLKQVLWNYLTNAVKFTPSGGTICVTLRREPGWVVVEVTDSGSGIEPALLPHVFERFRQGPEGVRKGGLGLGLAIVREIIHLHGGSVEARSEGHGRGATFVARIPAK